MYHGWRLLLVASGRLLHSYSWHSFDTAEYESLQGAGGFLCGISVLLHHAHRTNMEYVWHVVISAQRGQL